MEELPKKTKLENISSEQEKNIQEVFTLCPELEQIGTSEQYGKYLETIFPESKVKNILWHGTDVDFKDEGFKAMPPSSFTKWFTEESLGNKFYFTDDKQYAERKYSIQNKAEGLLISAVVDFKKPKDDDSYDGTDLRNKDLSAYDSYVQKPSYQIDGTKNHQNFIAFTSEQVHILGSQADIEGFKGFVATENK